MTLLRERLVQVLASKCPGFSPEYPAPASCRGMAGEPLAKRLDHTLLKQAANQADFIRLCAEARRWEVWAVCLPSNRVTLAMEQLAGSPVKVCTVVGFPFGYANTEAKITETRTAIAQGADEIDVALPVGLLNDGDWVAVYQDVRAVVEAAQGRLVKVILETSELSLESKVIGSYIACFAGAGFLKTSSGFASGGAVLDDLHILRTIAGERIGVKASGGIRSTDFALACLKAGADRIGSSSTGTILGKVEGGGGPR
jgi:deoxyribose-phosphate aldolase